MALKLQSTVLKNYSHLIYLLRMTMASFDLSFDCRVASEIAMVVAARTRRTRVLLLRAPPDLECALHAPYVFLLPVATEFFSFFN